MPRCRRPVLALLAALAGGAAGEAPALAAPPGRTAVAGPAPARAWEVRWDAYRTWLVVGPTAGRIAPAWVVTWNVDPPEPVGLAVAYRGRAYVDAAGWIHIDAREASLAGPMRAQWIPDSFAIFADSQVQTIDDKDRGHPGAVARTIPADGLDYARLLAQATALAQNGL